MRKDIKFYPIYLFFLVFRYGILIACIYLYQKKLIWENDVLNAETYILMKIVITLLLITLFDKFFHPHNPIDPLYLFWNRLTYPYLWIPDITVNRSACNYIPVRDIKSLILSFGITEK